MEPDCNAANSLQSWRTKLQNGSIFFPYSWCLAFKVLSVGPHTTHEAKLDRADLDVKVKVEYVLREGMETSKFDAHDRADNLKETAVRAGDTVTFCLSKEHNLDLQQYIDSLKGKTQVWAFTTWMNDHKRLHFDIEKRFEPFHNQEFSTNDLKELAADLRKVITDAQEAKRPIERYLRERWPENRIREFCHKDNRLIKWKAYPDPDEFRYDDFGFRGILYAKSALGEVMWLAYTVNKTPTSYGLIVKRGKSVWQLERSNFEFGSSLNDDDALKQRIHDTLSYAFSKSFDAHPRPPRTKEETGMQAIFSSTPLSSPPDWRTFTIERANNTRKVVAVSCETSFGRLRALLDKNKEIQTVTVNGKQDNDWMEALAEANKERSKLYDQ